MKLKIQRTTVDVTVAGLASAICETDYRFKEFRVLEIEAISAAILNSIEDNGKLTLNEETYRIECQRRFQKFSKRTWENVLRTLRLGGIIIPFWPGDTGERLSDWFLEIIEEPLPRDSFTVPYSLYTREGIEILNQEMTALQLQEAGK